MSSAENIANDSWAARPCSRRGDAAKGMGIARAARRAPAISGGAAPSCTGETAVRRGSERTLGRVSARGAAQDSLRRPVPIWLAALEAARCLANDGGRDHDVSWDCVAGRALYTNAGDHTEIIQPLGVSLRGGQTLAVCWMPGETGYTLEIYGGNEFRV